MDRGERQGIIGQMRGRGRDGRTGFGLKFFCGFCCEVFCEEKKRRENRIEERKKRRWGRPRGRERKNDQVGAMSTLHRYPTRTPDSRPPVTGVSSHSPAPVHQTLHSLSSGEPYETGSSSSAWSPSSTVATHPAEPAHLHVQLPHLRKERPDALVVLTFMQEHKLHIFVIISTIVSDIRGSRLLPGVTNADTVHSLNLSTDLRYLFSQLLSVHS